jgi:hypothetical protein
MSFGVPFASLGHPFRVISRPRYGLGRKVNPGTPQESIFDYLGGLEMHFEELLHRFSRDASAVFFGCSSCVLSMLLRYSLGPLMDSSGLP